MVKVFVAQKACKHLVDGGRLILMLSISAHNPVKDHAVYVRGKGAVEALTRCFAPELGARRTTVNSIVARGGIKMDMAAVVGYKYIPGADTSWMFEMIEQMVNQRTPVKLMAVRVDIARAIAFLASEDGGWMSGYFRLHAPCSIELRLTVSRRAEFDDFRR